MNPPIVLASTSRYRKALLERLRVPFTAVAPLFDEESLKGLSLPPGQLAEQLALKKALSLAGESERSIVIGCDQLGAFDGEILGKPGSREKAIHQLSRLCGKTHELYCSLAVLFKEKCYVHTEITKLTMAVLPAEAIERYVDTDGPLDCAGSYKIESLGISLFTRIEGNDPTAIEGFPLMALSTILRSLGVKIP